MYIDLIIYTKNIVMIPTKHHFKIIFTRSKSLVYLSIIANIFSGKYFPITSATSLSPILFLIKASILKNISTMAIKNTNDENL